MDARWTPTHGRCGVLKKLATNLCRYVLVANSTGDYDLLVHILVPDNAKLGELILKIKSIDGVLQGAGNIHISIFTRVFKDSHYVEPFASGEMPSEE